MPNQGIYQSGGQGITSVATLNEEFQGYYLAQALKVAIPTMALEKSMSLPESLPQANSMTVGFQRFEKLDPLNALTPMLEDVTPKSQKIKVTEYSARLQQYGGHVAFTKMLQLTSKNQRVQDYVKRLTEQALEVLEAARWNALKAGSNKFYSVGAIRTGVNSPISVQYGQLRQRNHDQGYRGSLGGDCRRHTGYRLSPGIASQPGTHR